MGVPYYGGSVIINDFMTRDIHMSASTRGFGFTLLNIFVGVAAIPAAISIVKIGLRATFVLGSVIICVGALYMGLFTKSAPEYLIAFGVVIGIGIIFATLVPAFTAVARWFRKYRGRANGIAVSASGIAGLLAAPLLGSVIRGHGNNWRLGWFIVAGAAVVAGFLAFFGVKESPESMGQFVDGIPPEQQEQTARTDALATKYPWTTSQAYRTAAYWLIALAGIVATFPFFLFVAHWAKRLIGVGFSGSDADWALGFLTIGTLVGRWIGGVVMDFINARVAFVLGLAVYIVGTYMAITAMPGGNGVWLAYCAALLNGAAYGWSFTCVGTMVAHYFGPAAFPKLYGTMTLLISLIASPAGIVGGWVFDAYKSYTPAFELNALLAVVGIVAIIFAAMPKPGAAVAAETVQAAAR
ncbi:MAG: MFS transporter [Acidobacteriota bacterium]|nr:MFS transporter [Acidobacteriota bacterium]MDE3170492.1 MFS transporter [Acidobacteriota bacterium]